MSVLINQDTGGADNLSYQDRRGVGIKGASIQIFTQANWNANNRGSAYVVAGTTADVFGRWVANLALNAGSYVLVYALAGSFGPDTVFFTMDGNGIVTFQTNITPVPVSVSTSNAYFVDATAGNVTITIPAANDPTAKAVKVFRKDATTNHAYVQAAAGTIEGVAQYELFVQREAVEFTPNAEDNDWYKE
jgi:hypothetical protein